MADDKQEKIDETTVQDAPKVEPVKSGKGDKKSSPNKQSQPESPKQTKSESKPMQLISFSEYVANAEREVSSVLQHGFKIWMKTERNEPLRARMHFDWDNLIEKYLKS